MQVQEINGKNYYTSREDHFWVYKRNFLTDQMVPVGFYQAKPEPKILGLLYPENKKLDTCNFLNLYYPEFYIEDVVFNRKTICFSESYILEDSKYLALSENTVWLMGNKLKPQQIYHDEFTVLGFMLAFGMAPRPDGSLYCSNALLFTYDQFLSADMFQKSSEEAKQSASIKNILKKNQPEVLDAWHLDKCLDLD